MIGSRASPGERGGGRLSELGSISGVVCTRSADGFAVTSCPRGTRVPFIGVCGSPLMACIPTVENSDAGGCQCAMVPDIGGALRRTSV
eukprot:910398-Prymnesium_polylepis.1